MAVAITIESGTGVAIATCTGALRLDESKDSVSTLWKTPEWLGKSVVWDFREAEFDIYTLEIHEIAHYVLAHQPSPPPSRVAFVIKRDVDFDKAELFKAAREDPFTEFRLFRDYDEALKWARVTDLGEA